MKANSLRIGNLILFPAESNNGLLIPSVIRKVDAIEIGKVTSLNPPSSPSNFEAKIKNCGGIKLTEEWVKKFGFNFQENYWQIKIAEYLKIGFDSERLFLVIDVEADDYYSIQIDLPIKYVHELQNLFFAITGTELEMK